MQPVDGGMSVARTATSARLEQLHADLAARYGREDWRRAAAIPGWAERLDELEEAYTTVWKAGGDPRRELDALADHWRTGLGGSFDNEDNTFDLFEYTMERMRKDEEFLRLLPQMRRFLAKELSTGKYRAVRNRYHELIDQKRGGDEISTN
jgi:hypothetical protein